MIEKNNKDDLVYDKNVVNEENKSKSEYKSSYQKPYDKENSREKQHDGTRTYGRFYSHHHRRREAFRPSKCLVCKKKSEINIDYKEVMFLQKFTTDRGKIMPRRFTGICAKHYRLISAAIRRARVVALMPYIRM